MDDPVVDASEIEVAVQNREVTLTGTVRSRSEKRRAEDVAESLPGVNHVQNNLRVGQPQAGHSTGTDAREAAATNNSSVGQTGAARSQASGQQSGHAGRVSERS
jgi:hypothetical protein